MNALDRFSVACEALIATLQNCGNEMNDYSIVKAFIAADETAYYLDRRWKSNGLFVGLPHLDNQQKPVTLKHNCLKKKRLRFPASS